MRRAIALLTCATALGACLLFPSLSGFTRDDASVSDVAEGSAFEASSDAVTIDGSPDAGPDGGFCATHTGHTFCEDFDEPNYEGRWSGVTINGGGVAVESDASFVSPPNDLLATSTLPANGGVQAFAFKHFPALTTMKAQFAVFIDPSSASQLNPVVFYFTPAPAGYSTFQFHIDATTKKLGLTTSPSDAGMDYTSVNTACAVTLTTWQNVEVDLDVVAGTVTVLVNGAIAVNNWGIPAIGVPNGVEVRLGIATGQNASNAPVTAGVHIDNVLVDTK